MRKPWIASLLLAVLLLPLVGAFATTAGDGCSGHVCACVKHCPPRKTGPMPCHGNELRPSDEMYGRCHHPAPAFATSATFVLPESIRAEIALVVEAAPPLASALPRAGFEQALVQPPRAA